MLKKTLTIMLALLMVFAMVGCSNGTTSKPYTPPYEPPTQPPGGEDFESDLVQALGTGGEWVMVLKQTQYSDGAQYLISDAKLMDGNKIVKDDKYKLELEFTVDRVPTTNIFVFFVQNDPDDWVKLTNTVEIDKAGLTVGTKKSVTLEFTASATAKAATTLSNKLAFETQEKKDSGSDAADLTMTFTKFVLTKEGSGTAEPPPPPPEGDTLNNPVMEHAPSSHSTWNGTDNADGSFTITTGGLRYAWPAKTAAFDIADYDFVEVTYTASGANSTMVKHYAAANDFDPFEGSKNISDGTKSFTLEIRNDASGFAIQKYQAGSGDLTIQFTKLVFIKGTRYNVTLNPDGGDVTPTSTYLVKDTLALPHLPTPTKAGNNFSGWKLGGTAITATTKVDASFANATLVAQWLPQVSVVPITVNFTSITFRKIGSPTIDVVDAGAGYEYTYGSGSGNNWSLGAFKVTLAPGATLADYDTVSFYIQGIGGDYNYKDLLLLDASGASSGGFAAVDITVAGPTASGNLTPVPTEKKVLTIDKPKAASLTGEIEVAIYMSAGDSSGTTKYKIWGVVIE